MAEQDRQTEHFIREVDEELRRAQLKSIWDRFAPLIVGVCLLVVLLTAGYRGWLWWQERQGSQAGDRYTAALERIEAGDRAAGEAELAQIAEGGGGYAVLARLRLAGEKAAAGEKAEALAAFDAVMNDANADGASRDLARLRGAILALDTGDLAGARDRAAPLDQPGNPWRHAAREVLGTVAYQSGQLQEARDRFTAIQQDAETPPDLWARSGMMVALVDGQLATAAPAPGAAPAAPPAPGSTVPTTSTPEGAAPGTEPAATPPPPSTPSTLEIPAGEAPVMSAPLPADTAPPPADTAPAAAAGIPAASAPPPSPSVPVAPAGAPVATPQPAVSPPAAPPAFPRPVSPPVSPPLSPPIVAPPAAPPIAPPAIPPQ